MLIQLNRATKAAVRDILVDGWSVYAPAPLVEQFLARTHRRAPHR